jgi:hypothetical protein
VTLDGCWLWTGSDDFDFEIIYESNKCKMTAYDKGGSSKLSEDFFYYEISNDTINYLNYSEKYDTIIFSYIIVDVSENVLHLKDIPDNKSYEYKRICDSPPTVNKLRYNEFLMLGNAIAFISDTISDYVKDGLKIGQLNINESFNSASNKLGNNIYKSLNGINGTKNHVFLLDTIGENINYMVLSERNDTILGIQLTGLYTERDYSFSSIRLGDYYNYVEQKLGMGSRQDEVKEINGYRWSYEPFPFSIEFVNDRVYSIRINK